MTKSNEFFVHTMSDPAPFCGDADTFYRTGPDATIVLNRVKAKYDHPAGLHSVSVYKSADAFHKNQKPLASYRHRCGFE